jgi:uncharacterized membrane protein YphA (DoxX/SURF4 family)
MGGSRAPGKNLIAVGRVLIAIAAIFFGVQHFLHPLGLPGVPLEKQMPTWIPARPFIDYLTGAFLIVAGVCFLLARKTRMAATYLGAWIVLLVVVIYGPVLIGALADPSTAVKVEGLNYFADTLLFGGVILSRQLLLSRSPVRGREPHLWTACHFSVYAARKDQEQLQRASRRGFHDYLRSLRRSERLSSEGIAGKEYDICLECWNPLAQKLRGRGRVKNRETVFLPAPRINKEREDKEPGPLPGEPPKIWGAVERPH